MNKHYLSLTAVGVLVFIFSGCSSKRISLSNQGFVSLIKQENEENVIILWADIYKMDGKIWAYGAIKPKNSDTLNTHMDIEILDNEGFFLYETITEEITIKRACECKIPKWEKI